MKYTIAYEDAALIIINKPQGLATGIGTSENLCAQVFNDYPGLSKIKGFNNQEGGLLNRLDNETGGLVLWAKTDTAFQYYSLQMKNGKVKKTYTAVVSGSFIEQNGRIETPIAHHLKNSKKMVLASHRRYRGHPQNALTLWKVIGTLNNNTILEIIIYKGVRHQIRLHLASINHPILGDKLYASGVSLQNHDNHLLYASGLEFYSMENQLIKVSVEVPFLKWIV